MLITDKIISKSVNSIVGSIAKGFSGVEDQLDRNLKIKRQNNKQLMDFQRTLNLYNSQLHKLLLIQIPLSKDKSKSNYVKHKKALINTEVNNIKTSIIVYISLWSVNFTHGMIKRDVIYKSLGVLISDEYLTLQNNLIDIQNNAGKHYADAKNCTYLFKQCGNKHTYNYLKQKNNTLNSKGGH